MCAKCRFAVYCSATCQREHWSTHQITCNELPINHGLNDIEIREVRKILSDRQISIDQLANIANNVWKVLEFRCPNASLGRYVIQYLHKARELGRECNNDDVYKIHALSKQIISSNVMGTLHFKDPPNWLFKAVDRNERIGKNIFGDSDDLVNECFENLRKGVDRDDLEEIVHWHLNHYDRIIPPDISSNNTKGHERNQLIKMVLFLLGLISIDSSNSVNTDRDRCRIICMALGLTTTTGWNNISPQLRTGIHRVRQILQNNRRFQQYMVQSNVSSTAWSINVLKVAMNYNDRRLANTIWSSDKASSPLKKQKQTVKVLVDDADNADNVRYHAFDSTQDVAQRMVDYAKEMHPSRRIVSKERVIDMLERSLGSGNSVYGIVVFSSDVPGVYVAENSNTIRDMTDHERVTLCGCKGSCLNSHGTDCENDIIYERLVANLFSYTNIQW